jgi:hypothetical protein
MLVGDQVQLLQPRYSELLMLGERVRLHLHHLQRLQRHNFVLQHLS